MSIITKKGPIPKALPHKRRGKLPPAPWEVEAMEASRALTKAERAEQKAQAEWFGAVAKQACCLALNWGPECVGRTTVAHTDGAGMGMKSHYKKTFACCEGHHLRGPNSIGQMGVKAWTKKYGPQSKYVAVTQHRLRLAGFAPAKEGK